jgi:hypothetical protein
VTSTIFESLREHYEHCKARVDSLVDQINKINEQIKEENCLMDLNGTIQKIKKLYKCMNNGLMDSLNFINNKYLKLKQLYRHD